MHGDGHVGWNIGDRGIDHARIDRRQLFRILPAGDHLRPQLRIAEIGEIDFVELQVTAARVGESARRATISLPEVAVEIGHIGIDRLRDRIPAIAKMQR